MKPPIAVSRLLPFAFLAPNGLALLEVPQLVHADDSTLPPITRTTLGTNPPQSPAAANSVRFEPSITPDLSGLRHELSYAEHEDGTWVRGEDYKAHPSAEGFTFIPFLGSDAPQNFPLTLRLRSAEIGGTALHLTERAKVSRQGDQFLLDRGPVDVLYDIRPGEVEQLFVVETHGRSGDLVLRIEATTELLSSAQTGGFQFTEAGSHGARGVQYGAAHVVRPSGDVVPISSYCEAGEIELRVPSALVQSLGGQVVVDPVISTFSVTTYPAARAEVDVAYDNDTGGFLYVWSEVFSMSDRDVYLKRASQSGVISPGQWSFDHSDRDTHAPSIATLASSKRALVAVAQETFGGDRIAGRIYDFTLNNWIAPSFTIGDVRAFGSVQWRNARPDVGGSSSAGDPALFCVAWERYLFDPTGPWDSDNINFLTVDASGTLGLLRGIAGSTSQHYSRPAISKSTGVASTFNRWNLCFGLETSAVSNEVMGCQLNADGTFATTMQTLHAFPLGLVMPKLEVSDGLSLRGLDPTYIVLFRDHVAFDGLSFVACRNNLPLGGKQSLPQLEHKFRPIVTTSGATDFLADYALGTTQDQFVVAQLYNPNGATGTEALTTTLSLATDTMLAVAERRTTVSAPGAAALFHDAAIASAFSGGQYASRVLGLGWTDNGTHVMGAAIATNNDHSPAVQYCEGTLNSTGDKGFLRLSGTSSTSGNKTAIASHLPPNQFSMLYASLLTGFTPMFMGDGTLCLGSLRGEYRSQIGLSSSAGIKETIIDPAALELGGFSTSPAIPGLTCHFQMWGRDLVGSRSTTNYTNGVTLTFD